MRIQVAPAWHELAPGEELVLQVSIVNDGEEHLVPVVTVGGVAADVVRYDPPVELGPGQSSVTELRLRIPLETPPGDQRLVVTVADADGQEPPAWAATELRVGAPPEVSVELSPNVVRGRRTGRLDTIIRHLGDEPRTVRLVGGGEGVDVRFRADEIDLDVHDAVRVPTRIHRLRRSWFTEVRHGVLIEVSGTGAPVSVPTSFTQRPILPPVLVKSLALILVLALWAGAVVAVNQRLASNREAAALAAAEGASEEPTEDASGEDDEGASGEGDGEDDEAGVNGAVLVQGAVDGPRDPAGTKVVIERIAFGDEGTTDGGSKLAALTPVRLPIANVVDRIETTTDERGRFRFAGGLTLPAFYRVSALREGFDVSSVVIETTEAEAEHDLAMSLVPAPGAMAGRVTSTDSGAIGGADIIVTDGELVYRTTTATDGAAAGTWSLQGLATPATYQIRAVKRGYASASVLRQLDGGQQLSGVDLQVAGDLGTLHGLVTYRNVGVGAITIQLAGEDIERTTTTLTDAGLVGLFELPALPYGTYQLTFSAEGWLTQTSEVVIDRGDVELIVRDLLPATAILQGAVEQEVAPGGCAYPDPEHPAERTDAELTPCGGVGVTATGPEGTFKTTTATGTGTFQLSGLPPGEYTVAFQRFGYVPVYLAVNTLPGDILTLPSDGIEVEGLQPAQAGSSGRIQMLLLPETDDTAGQLQGVLRRADDVEAVFAPPTGTAISVVDQPAAVVESLAEGAFRISELPVGAHTVRIDAPGFDVSEVVVRVGGEEATDAGTIPLTPLATLALQVTDNLEFPIAGAEVFVAAASVEGGRLDATTDPNVRSCSVRKDPAGRWRVGAAGTVGETLTGLCVKVTATGEAALKQAFGTGSYRIITPVDEIDLAAVPATTVEARKVRAGTVPLDHHQLERLVEVRSGETSRIDLRARRYPIIEGRIRDAQGAGWADAAPDAFFHPDTGIDALSLFPALTTFVDQVDPTDPTITVTRDLGIGFEMLVDGATTPTTPPSGLAPRLSYGPADGLPVGVYRINRVLPSEPSLTRDFALGFHSASGRRFEYQQSTAITGLTFGETRIANAVLLPSPVPLDLKVVRTLASGAEVNVAGATVEVSGIVRYIFDNGALLPIVEVVTVTTDANGEAQAKDASGDEVLYLADQDLEITVTREGFETLTTTAELEAGQPVKLNLVPVKRDISGSIRIEPIAASTGATLGTLDVWLERLGVTPTVEIRTGLTRTVVGDRLDIAFDDVEPDIYRLHVEATDVHPYTSIDLDIPIGRAIDLVQIGPAGIGDTDAFLVDRRVALTVDVTEVFPATGGTTLDVSGATVDLYLDGTMIDTATTPTSGEVSFADLRGGPSRQYHLVITKTGYLTYDGSGVTFRLTDVANTEPRALVRYGSITGTLRSYVSPDDTPAPLAGATVRLLDATGVALSPAVETTTAGDGTYSFPHTREIAAGNYQLEFSATDHVTETLAVTVANATITTVPTEDIEKERSSATGRVSVATGGTPLRYVKVTAMHPTASTEYASVVIGPGDADFSLTGLPPTTVRFRFEEFTDAGATIETSRKTYELQRTLVAGQTTTGVDLAMADEHVAISGIVTGQDFDVIGAPSRGLVGATVTATCTTTSTCGFEPDMVTPATFTATTTTGGAYSFPVLPVGTYDLTFTAAGYTDGNGSAPVIRFTSAPLPLDVTLTATPKSTTVTVTSTGTGTPALVGVTVTATYNGSPAPTGTFSGTTEGTGKVTFSLPPGTWTIATTDADAATVSPRPHGNPSTQLTFAATDGAQTLPLGAAPYVRLSGIVLGRDHANASASALDGVLVTPVQQGGASTAYPVVAGSPSTAASVTTGLDGAWAAFVPPTNSGSRSWVVEFTKASYDGADVTVAVTPSTADLVVAAPAPTGVAATARATLAPEIVAGGLALDASPVAVPVAVTSDVETGNLAGLTVNAVWAGGGTAPPATGYTTSVTSATTVRSLLLAPGSWTFSTAGAPGIMPPHKNGATSTATAVVVGAIVPTQTIALTRYALIHGTAVDVNADPQQLVGTLVSASSPSTAVPQSPTAADGIWRVWVPDPVDTTITLDPPDYDATTFTALATDARWASRVLNYGAVQFVGGMKEVRVTVVSSVDATLLQGVTVTAHHATLGNFTSSVSDANGVAVFSGLSPATWEFRTTGGTVLKPPHKNVLDADNVTRKFNAQVTSPVIMDAANGNQARLTLTRYASVRGVVGTRPYASAGLTPQDGVTVTRLGAPATAVVEQPSGTGPWTTVGASGVTGLPGADATGRWRIWLPDPRLLSVSFSMAGYTSTVVDLPQGGARDFEYTTPVSLTAVPRPVEVTVVSSVGATTLQNVTVHATSGAGTAQATTNGNGVASFSGLAPTTWTFTTTGGPGLATPHENITGTSVTRTVEPGTTTQSFSDNTADGRLTLTRYALVHGTVVSEPYAAGPETAETMRPTTTLVEAEIRDTTAGGAWSIWVPATGSSTNSGTVTFTKTGYSHPLVGVDAGDIDGTPPAYDAGKVVLTAEARDVDIEVRGKDASATAAVLEGVTVTATWNGVEAGPPGPFDAVTGVDGIASFTGTDALAPGDWLITTADGADATIGVSATVAPHEDETTGVVRTVAPGTTTASFTGATDGITLVQYASVSGTVSTRLYAGQTPAPAEITPAVTDLTGYVTAPTTTSGDWRVWFPAAGAATTDGELTFEETGFTTQTRVVTDGALVGSSTVILTALAIDVDLKVVSSASGKAALSGAVITASATGQPTQSGTATGSDGLVSFTDLPPLQWTFASTNATSLTPPHEDGSTVKTLTVGMTSPQDYTASPEWLELTPYVALAGTVETRAHATGTEADGSVTPTVTSGLTGALVDPSAAAGTWRVWLPPTTATTTGGVLAFAESGYEPEQATVTDGAVTSPVDGAVVLTAVPRIVRVLVEGVDSTAGTTANLAGVTVTATYVSGSGLASETAVSNGVGIATFSESVGPPATDTRLAPGTWRFTTSGATGYHNLTVGDDEQYPVDVGGGAADPGLDTAIQLAKNSKLYGRVGEYRAGEFTYVIGVVIRAERTGESYSTTSVDPKPNGDNYALQAKAGTWRITAIRDGVTTVVDEAFEIIKDGEGTTPNWLEIVLPRDGGAELAGTVVDDAGAGVPGATISATSSAGTASTTSGDGGTYSLKGLDPDVTWKVTFTPPAGAPGSPVTRYVAPGGSTSTPITLSQTIPSGLGSIGVAVTGGEPGAAVGVTLTETGPFPTVATDGILTAAGTIGADGTYATSFDDLVPGGGISIPSNRFTVTVTVDGHEPLTRSGVEVFSGTATPVAFELSSGSVATTDLVLILVSADGPVVDRSVELLKDLTVLIGIVTPGTNVYTFHGVEPGEWQVSVEGYEPVTVSVPAGVDSHTAELILVAVPEPEATSTDGSTEAESTEPEATEAWSTEEPTSDPTATDTATATEVPTEDLSPELTEPSADSTEPSEVDATVSSDGTESS